jgi:hypothetical protein
MSRARSSGMSPGVGGSVDAGAGAQPSDVVRCGVLVWDEEDLISTGGGEVLDSPGETVTSWTVPRVVDQAAVAA